MRRKKVITKVMTMLLTFAVVLSMMPVGAVFAGGDDSASAYTGSVIAAPIHDNSEADAIADDDLAAYYGVSYKDGTATVAALELQSFKLSSDGDSGKWVGLAIEVPAETTYSNIQIGTDPAALASAGKTKADYTTNEKSYVTYYWDMNSPISNLYFSFDGGTTKYAISVKTATVCNVYVGDDSYTGKENFVMGNTYHINAYICSSNWENYFTDCQWNTEYLSGLGVNDTAADATYGYGASVEFTPAKAGEYSLKLTDNQGAVIKTLTLNVVANDLRGLASGSLDFYYTDAYGESSMLGNYWCAGKELSATKGESNESLKSNYKYLSAYTTAPSDKTYDQMSVDWYYSNTYSPTGAGYTKVSTGGKETGTVGTANQITYYNGEGYYDNSFFFNIYPDVTTAGTYYYYVVISDGTDTITSLSNQAVVTVSLPKGDLGGITDGVDNCLKFYNSGGYEYSMLGNNWYAGNELKANVNATAEEMGKDYLYLSACTTVPDGKTYTDMTVEWYYGKTYNATGEGYTKVSTGGAASDTAGVSNQITYYNGKGSYADYFFFNIYPDVTTAGTYYYYAEISYTDDGNKEHKISSVGCQAMVVVSEKTYTEALTGNITVDFTLNGYSNFTGISTQSITVKNGSSVGDVFKKVLDENGYTYKGLEKGYISSITSATDIVLEDFSAGKNSGWMYLIENGGEKIAPNVGLNSYILSNGDKITWYFTPDYTKDEYAIASMTTTENQKVTTTGSDTKITTAPAEVKTSGTTATATITDANTAELVKQAKENSSKEVVINASSTKNTETVDFELDRSTLETISKDTSATVTVKTDAGEINLDKVTLDQIAGEATGKTVIIEITRVSEPDKTQKSMVGTNGQIFKLTVKSGDTVISQFNGYMTVRLAVPDTLKDKDIAAVHITGDKLEKLEGNKITQNKVEFYEFKTSNFSEFALVDTGEVKIDSDDKSDNIDKAKSLIKELKLSAISSKTTKKNVKITVKMNSKSKSLIKELGDMGYTVKYKYYRSVKKASKYTALKTKASDTFVNTKGKKGTKYYYKVKAAIYDGNKVVAQSALKQCSYAVRTWSK